MRRRRRRACVALGLWRASAAGAARTCPIASAEATSVVSCGGREAELQIWNDASRAIVVFRVDEEGRERGAGIKLKAGSVVRRSGCEGTLWRARRADGARLVSEFSQGGGGGGSDESPLVVSVSDTALDERHGSGGGVERWRVGDCEALPPLGRFRSNARERSDAAASFELEVILGNVDSRARSTSTEALHGPEIVADVDVTLAEAYAGGKDIGFSVKRDVPCGFCGGRGAAPAKLVQCDRCQGSGVRPGTWLPKQGASVVDERRTTLCGQCSGWGETYGPGRAACRPRTAPRPARRPTPSAP